MAASLIHNALQVNFDSVLSFPDEGMVQIFKSLESTGLRDFLVCPSVLYEDDLVSLFAHSLVRENEIISCVQRKFVGISEDQFASTFGLPTEGLTSMDEVSKGPIYDARSVFSASGEPVKTSCKKKEMKIEFRLLNDILAKSVTVKAASFDAVNHELFLLMTGIQFGLKINWRKIFFDILKDMATKSSKQAKGFAAQICVLLKGAPDLTLGETKTFPPLKILTVRTVGTYFAKIKTITTEEVADEPQVEKVVKKAATKRIPAPATEPIANRKRTTVGRAAPTENDLALVPVATEAEPISIVPAESPSARRRREPKRKLILQRVYDDEKSDEEEIVEQGTDKKRPAVEKPTLEETVEEIVAKIIAETTEEIGPLAEMEKEKEKETEKEAADKGKRVEKIIDSEDTEPLSKVLELTKTSMSDEESMSIDDLLQHMPEDMMLSSVTAEEPTKIRFGHGIAFRELRASVDQIQLEQVRTRDDVAELKAALSSNITNLEKAFAPASTHQEYETQKADEIN
ncbi:hypothetical protein F511_24839 [Dorcoceras hygrometricum]|uniref:Splicing factor 3B subunit 1-like n=1 Tax=Dorcoceras hygrometricum TaxID=472368 RepID=A0A2Z7AU99_9LAMI|nr:hypothetical protein F511_24839 [Dorcoceras hygrometricum]